MPACANVGFMLGDIGEWFPIPRFLGANSVRWGLMAAAFVGTDMRDGT